MYYLKTEGLVGSGELVTDYLEVTAGGVIVRQLTGAGQRWWCSSPRCEPTPVDAVTPQVTLAAMGQDRFVTAEEFERAWQVAHLTGVGGHDGAYRVAAPVPVG